MNTIGERLKEERLRLGKSQEAFGQSGGVQKRAQINYEAGERVPDAEYLAALGAIGVDVLYVLTGVHAAGNDDLSPDERILIDNYRRASGEGRRIIQGASDAAIGTQRVVEADSRSARSRTDDVGVPQKAADGP